MLPKLLISLIFISQIINSEISSNDYINHYFKNKENTELLKVDLVIIQNLNIEQVDLKEQWADLNTFNFSKDLLILKEEPTKLVSPPASYLGNDSLFKFTDSASLNTVDQNFKTKALKADPFLYERIPFEIEMQEIEKNLNRSKDYRVLYYNSWLQPAFKRNKTLPLVINQIKKNKKVYGEIKIYKERFIHLDSRLRFAEEINGIDNDVVSKPSNTFEFQTLLSSKEILKKPALKENNYWVDTIFNTVQLNIQNLAGGVYQADIEDLSTLVEEPIISYKDLYEIKKEIKIEEKGFNFIDHPFFSILIRVEEVAR